jgi:hypothetical protein
MFLQHENPRVKIQSFVDVRRWCYYRRTLLRGVASGDSSRPVAVVVVMVLVVRLVCVGREVRRAHVGVASGWRAWCSGDLGDGRAEVFLS